MTSWLKDEVDQTAAKLREAVAGVYIERPDYGFGLTAIKSDVGKPGVAVVVKVYQPARDDIGQPEIRNSLEYTIAVLNGASI